MRVGSLFSGAGLMDWGLTLAGHEHAWFCENDSYCQRVLERRYPGIPIYSDVRDVDERVEQVDVLAGGFPCQPVSVAGSGRGRDDERWLWPEFLRVIRLLRPRYVLVENVPGLLAAGMGDVLGGLASCGYDAEWDCIPAAAFGAPHRRDRLFIVAYPEATGQLRTNELEDGSQGERGGRRPDAPSGRLVFREPRPSPTEWGAEPGVGRVANGVPHRMERLGVLGNGVVPAVAEWIGSRLR